MLGSVVVWAQPGAQRLPSVNRASDAADIVTLPGIKLGDAGRDESVVSVTAELAANADGRTGTLSVRADVAPGWHIYSITQPRGGPVPTTIKLDDSSTVRLTGSFQASPPPLRKTEPLFDNLAVETHARSVSWIAPVEFAAGLPPGDLKVSGHVNAQACDESRCLPPKKFPFAAQIAAGAVASAAAAGEPASIGVYKHANSHATIRAHLEPEVAAPGTTVKLVLSAEPAAGYHVYALAERDPQQVSKPTLIALTNTSSLLANKPVADRAPTEKPSEVFEGEIERYHAEPIRWTIDLQVPSDAKPGEHLIEGIIGYQACSDRGCDLPMAARFSGTIVAGAASTAGETPLALREAKYAEAAAIASAGATSAVPEPSAAQRALPPQFASSEIVNRSPLAIKLGAALLGGFILNFMPCVLPVIGLKVLSFVEQGGRDRRRVFALNVWYVLGMMLVFLVLATLAVIPRFSLGWGQQFASTPFNIALSGLVFVMALSFLGVWEIPIPGFVGSGTASDLAQREGAAGALAKGAITTVLATPCSGPLLGPVFGFTINQPPAMTYAIFTAIGLGMAAPYLVIGAFPRLVRFLPKPGAWMETFKQLMGFVLLGTVVFLFTFMEGDYVVPTFGLLVGLWLACWWIGRTPLTAELGDKLRAWGIATVLAAAIGWLSFGLLLPSDEGKLAWQPFSVATLERLTAEGHTVMVDFTADWCLVCKTNEWLVLNTEKTRELVEANGVVPLLADWTDGSEEIQRMLESLGSRSIPVTAIFPAGRPNEPIVLRDLLSQGQLLNALREAGPSRPRGSQATAMRGQ